MIQNTSINLICYLINSKTFGQLKLLLEKILEGTKMRLHLKRLATGAFILAILLGSLWISINNEQLLNTILYVVSFCIISYLIGYFILKIRIKWWKGKWKLLKKMNFTSAMKDKKGESNNSGRANYRKNRKSQRNRKENFKI